jgi:geranylgeranyl pyrophosphate synthase
VLTDSDPAADLLVAEMTSEMSAVPSPRTSADRDDDWLQSALDEVLDTGPLAAPALGEDHRRLREALLAASAGGKRFRPRLVAAVHDVLGGTATGALAHVAAAVELLHTAFVVHDDVIDRDQTRRGRATVPGRFLGEARAAGADEAGAHTYAVAGAVLTGDLALSAAFRAVATAPVAGPVTGRLLDLVDRALVVSATGELTDVRLSLGLDGPSLAEALTMEEHKTAVYSFELPMQAGAVLAGAPLPLVAGMGEVGRLLGVAFQLRDDLLGLFGDPAATGKSNLADLREGKCTPLIVHARSTPAWPVVAPYLGDPELDVEGAATVRRALEASGSRRFVEDLADRYVETASARASALGLPPGFVGSLEALCRSVPAAAR